MTKINDLQKTTEELQRQLEWCMNRWHACPYDYFGLAEFAAVMGCSKQKLSNQLKRGTLIEPVAKLNMGPVWTRQQVREYILNSF